MADIEKINPTEIVYAELLGDLYGQQIVSHVATQLQQEYETKSFRTAIQRGSSAPITQILSRRQRIIHRPMSDSQPRDEREIKL
ncbi:MAG: hypothetical protein II827_02080 [Paludibacteraceae bacterium]|nr:hypothetical protein [Paludibacteraceae bacterium]